MTDKELIRKVHNGSKEALNMIADRYYDEIYRFCLYLTGQETDSYDIAQEVFLRFIKYVDSYEYRNLKGYLLIIARNLCRDYFHHKKETCCIEDNSYMGAEDEKLNSLENRMVLWQALQQIPVKQREIIILRIYEELRFHEIAEILGCNQSTVKSRFRLGIKSLRKIMEVADEES
ncbi:MAG: RNA polymerase sigma factor [Lachnospiraceae bacterium]|nr:RNA polymerase sigma factor [Lachnospiraceae bacterium]